MWPKILLVLYLPEVLLGVFLKDHLSDHVVSLLKALQWPQGSPDKIVIPGNSLQATCALAFGYSSLCAFPLGRAGPVPAFFIVVSLCPALCLECHGRQINTHQGTKVRFYLWRPCFGHRPPTPLPHTVPIPTTVLTAGMPSAQVLGWALLACSPSCRTLMPIHSRMSCNSGPGLARGCWHPCGT